MSDDPCTIGIMHPAFSTSKTVLLEWINNFFELDYAKVEQCASGAVHCQIADAIFPGKVPMSRVNWIAKSEYEYVSNFKILQSVFLKAGVQKPVPIDKLVKAKYQDNLEWLQWMKHFFDCKYSGEEYNPQERRAKAGKKGLTKKTGGATKPRTTTTTRKTAPASGTADKKPAASSSAKTSSAAAAEIKALNEKISQLNLIVTGLERERDFYFGKLRTVEIECQKDESTETIAKEEILKILYKTDEEDGEAETEDAGAQPAQEEEEEETF